MPSYKYFSSLSSPEVSSSFYTRPFHSGTQQRINRCPLRSHSSLPRNIHVKGLGRTDEDKQNSRGQSFKAEIETQRKGDELLRNAGCLPLSILLYMMSEMSARAEGISGTDFSKGSFSTESYIVTLGLFLISLPGKHLLTLFLGFCLSIFYSLPAVHLLVKLSKSELKHARGLMESLRPVLIVGQTVGVLVSCLKFSSQASLWLLLLPSIYSTY